MSSPSPRAAVPDFLVIGAGKSGTTSLDRYLRQHPGIAMCARKEPNWFAFDGQDTGFAGRTAWPVTDALAYARLFEHARPGQRLGEVSPVYLRSPVAAHRAAAAAPEARLVLVLRDPVARAISHHAMSVRDGLDSRGLDAAVRAEAARPEPARPNPSDCRYLADGEYHRQLVPWLERFDAARVHVLLHEELEGDPAGTMRALFAFLGVDPDARIDATVRHNRGGAPRSRLVQYALRPRGWTAELRARLPDAVGATWDALTGALKRGNRGAPASEPVDPATLDWLRAWFRDDVERLQSLIGRDLAHWLRGPAPAPGAAAGTAPDPALSRAPERSPVPRARAPSTIPR